MKRFWKSLLFLLILAALGAAGYKPTVDFIAQQNKPKWRTSEVVEGRIVATVNATGSLKPVIQIAVGSFVSGPILELNAQFNQEVKKGDLLARIDPLLYDANVARDKANLNTRKAEVLRVKAQLQQAINDYERAQNLRKQDPTFVAQQEMDKYRFAKESLDAQLALAYAAIEQAQAQLDNSEATVKYTKITAPEDGIIINRKIEPGQTLAAQFQTPELFVLAPDMKKKMHVQASVDEADIGLIRTAQESKKPVSFTVDAYPDEIFHGTIEEIRMNSTTTQNVVTYPVIVAAANPDLKLLPGMTANLSFQVDEREKTLKIPNAALRFFPQPKHVRKEDKHLVEGDNAAPLNEEEEERLSERSLSAEERSDLRRKRNRRHVWVDDGLLLKAVEVVTGLSDSKFTELVSGELKAGEKLVTGILPTTYGR